MTLILGILVLVIIQVASSAVVPQPREADEDGETARIVGGTRAERGQYPWAVALHYQGSFICTASIIGDTSVLTAAHCVVDDQDRPRDASLFYGIANIDRTAQSVRIDFSELFVNPDYASLDNDIAIFRASRSIAMSNNVGRVCLAMMDTPKNQFKNATAMGWGYTNIFGIPIPPRILQHVPLDLQESCPVLGVTENTDDKICAGGLLNAVCNGDSGGPLVFLSGDQRPIQIGITSYGNALFGCGRSTLPAVFTRVSAFIPFITSSTAGDTVCLL